VADLDAIAGGEPQRHALEVVVSSGLTPWIDAGLRSADQARLLVDFLESQSPRARIVASLESVPDLLTLTAIGRAVRWERLVFSLDLKNGRPLASSMGWAGQTPEEIAEQVVAVGVRSLIVLDLAGVGVGEGVPTLELCRRLRARFTQLELISGGGVRDVDDLRTLAASGCDTALVASALHDGRITRELLAAAAH
jgi:phosphoribosylformimino-5-aminoimidazole carboxamide ribotide isomerase